MFRQGFLGGLALLMENLASDFQCFLSVCTKVNINLDDQILPLMKQGNDPIWIIFPETSTEFPVRKGWRTGVKMLTV